MLFFYIAFQLLIKGTALHQQTFKVVLKAAACFTVLNLFLQHSAKMKTGGPETSSFY